MASLFAGALEGGRFVMAGRDCPSLGGVAVAAAGISFGRRDSERGPQPRCRFAGSRRRLHLPVVGRGLRATFTAGGIAALDAAAARPHAAASAPRPHRPSTTTAWPSPWSTTSCPDRVSRGQVAAPILWTIGHSSHSIETFLPGCSAAPASPRWPTCARPLLPPPAAVRARALKRAAQAGIAYVFLGDKLGARPADPACYRDGGSSATR
ncbi:MAG: hypothetical protein U1E53_34195 [Dongiaceae bacterium]